MLCGCQGEIKDVLETVEDEISVFSEDKYMEISVFIPQDTGTVQLSQTPASFVSEDGDYHVQTRRLLVSSAESALRQLTGNANATVLQTTRFQLPEYRFAWTEQGEENICYRGRMIQDGDVFYAVLIGVKESAGNRYDTLTTQVFASFGLYVDEEV
jgi:hypothetical protein